MTRATPKEHAIAPFSTSNRAAFDILGAALVRQLQGLGTRLAVEPVSSDPPIANVPLGTGGHGATREVVDLGADEPDVFAEVERKLVRVPVRPIDALDRRHGCPNLGEVHARSYGVVGGAEGWQADARHISTVVRGRVRATTRVVGVIATQRIDRRSARELGHVEVAVR